MPQNSHRSAAYPFPQAAALAELELSEPFPRHLLEHIVVDSYLITKVDYGDMFREHLPHSIRDDQYTDASTGDLPFFLRDGIDIDVEKIGEALTRLATWKSLEREHLAVLALDQEGNLALDFMGEYERYLQDELKVMPKDHENVRSQNDAIKMASMMKAVVYRVAKMLQAERFPEKENSRDVGQ